MFCFVSDMVGFFVDSCELRIHILQDYFTNTDAIF